MWRSKGKREARKGGIWIEIDEKGREERERLA
jgi:hypothetical protein